jgi:hypothetical protein
MAIKRFVLVDAMEPGGFEIELHMNVTNQNRPALVQGSGHKLTIRPAAGAALAAPQTRFAAQPQGQTSTTFVSLDTALLTAAQSPKNVRIAQDNGSEVLMIS